MRYSFLFILRYFTTFQVEGEQRLLLSLGNCRVVDANQLSQFTTICNSLFRGSDDLFWLLQTFQTHTQNIFKALLASTPPLSKDLWKGCLKEEEGVSGFQSCSRQSLRVTFCLCSSPHSLSFPTLRVGSKPFRKHMGLAGVRDRPAMLSSRIWQVKGWNFGQG